MMYLARRERGKLAKVFPVNVVREPHVWEFTPRLGWAALREPSLVCRPGFAAIARTPQLALTMLHSAFPAIYE